MNWQILKAKDYLMDFFQALLISLSTHKGCWIIPGGKMNIKDQHPPEFSAMREVLEDGGASGIALNSGLAWSLGSIFPPGIIQQPSCLDDEINSTWKKYKIKLLNFSCNDH